MVVKRVLEILDHEMPLYLNGLNRALGQGAILLTRSYAQRLQKVVYELVNLLEEEVITRGCVNCENQCYPTVVGCDRYDRLGGLYAGPSEDDHQP